MSAVADPNTLRGITLFDGLTPQQLSWLNQHLHRRAFAAGTSIMALDQPGEAVYFIESGAVKIQADQADGTEVTLGILGPGDIVGEMSLVDGIGRSADVITLEDSVLLWMARATFHRCVRDMPPVSFNLTRILSCRLRQANDQIQALATLGIQGRVARQILVFAQRYGRVTEAGDVLIPLRLTQSDLASLIGASRTRVNQAIAVSKERRYISINDDYHITVHDWDALAWQCRPVPVPREVLAGRRNGRIMVGALNQLQN